MKRNSGSNWLPIVFLVLIGLDISYTIYAAATYSGLYQWLAELELRFFGSYDPTGTFLALLLGPFIPVWVLTPREVLNRPLLKEFGVPKIAQGSTRRTILTVGTIALVIGVATTGVALWQRTRSHTVAVLDLNHTSGPTPHADRIVISGRFQMQHAFVVEEKINGSTSRTAYIPVTAVGWSAGGPIEYIERVEQGRPTRGEDATEAVAADQVRVGPAAILSRALPGVVRKGFERRGLRLASQVVVFDQNTSSRDWTLWLVAIGGFLAAIIFLAIGFKMLSDTDSGFPSGNGQQSFLGGTTYR